MSLVRSVLTVSLLLASTHTFADKITRLNYDRSWGAGLWSVSYTPDQGNSFTMQGLMLRAAYEFSPAFSVEGHLGTTEEDTSTTFGGTVPVSLRINVLGGVFAKYSWIYSQKQGWARFYGLLGMSFVDVQAEGQGITANDSDSGVSYGVGLDLFGSDRTAIVLEWVRYLEKSNYTIDTPMVGVVRRF
ncbi:MAG: porin family protein [Gammaproteobacteria bacterium]|nr:porin family protein [Gammaproteobacteria bacterium]